MTDTDYAAAHQRLDAVINRLFRAAVRAEHGRRYAEALAASRADEDCGPHQALARERMLAEDRTRARVLLECYAEAAGLDYDLATHQITEVADAGEE